MWKSGRIGEKNEWAPTQLQLDEGPVRSRLTKEPDEFDEGPSNQGDHLYGGH